MPHISFCGSTIRPCVSPIGFDAAKSRMHGGMLSPDFHLTYQLTKMPHYKPKDCAVFSASAAGMTRGVPSGGSRHISFPMLLSSTIVNTGTSLNRPSLWAWIFSTPFKNGSATMAANSYTVAPNASTKSKPANAVPPVAIKSSINNTRSPFLTAPKRNTISSLLYSVIYDPPVTSTPGNLPALRIIMKGIPSAKAIGGPKIKPRASYPATCVGPASPAAL
mmetsp:Transcript_1717/g.3119  ORF Transcript_1717/g.3119 Transcript_1717/m.3119 type:complete len:220 (+) Transcript_1717:1092-1751(+)